MRLTKSTPQRYSENHIKYDGTVPVLTFAKLCAGEVVINPASADNGARLTEALDALYRSAASGKVGRV